MNRLLVVFGVISSLVGAGGLVLGFADDPNRAGFAYLTAFTYFLTIAIGALYWVMIAHVTNAVWFVALRRVGESVMATLPLFAVLFWALPVFWGHAFGWTELPSGGLESVRRPALEKYVSAPFFFGRAVLFWLLICGFSASLRHDSLEQDRDPSVKYALRQRSVGAVGLGIVGLAVSFVLFDWLMPLDGAWRSTMYGVYVSAGAGAAGLALIAVLAELGRRTGRLPAAVGVSHFFAIGKLFIVTVLFWAYTGFCQLLLMWIADIPAESEFYARRVVSGWSTVSAALGIAHFGVPFVLLLSWRLKRSPARVAAVGAWLLVAHYVDVYWLILPAHDLGGPDFRWLDVAAFLAVGGACLAYGALRARNVPAMPVNDPRLEQSLEFENA